jgi:hypothetical protein
LGDKLGVVHANVDNKPITFQRFAKVLEEKYIGFTFFPLFFKQNLREDVNFSFWEWFFLIMQLIKQKLLKFWDEGLSELRRRVSLSSSYLGWLVGFISKQDASQRMLMCPNPTFLLRFSDTQTGAVSIGFVCEEDGVKGKSTLTHIYKC